MSTLVNEGGSDQGLVNVDKFELFIHLSNSNTKNKHFLEYFLFKFFYLLYRKTIIFFLNINLVLSDVSVK